MYIVRTNENGNQGRLFFVCPSKYSNKEHYNCFKFADDDDDDDDDDMISTICSNAAPRKAIRSEEFNNLRTRVSEVDSEIPDHGRRLRKIEKNFKAMLYVIVFCIVFYFIM
ncbi:hypothetical protein ACSBR2_041575 [Camellia fascicularis]